MHELFVGTERLKSGDFTHQIRVLAKDQLGELADQFNVMTLRLGGMMAEMAEKKRLEEELRIARRIQMSLLPESPPMRLPGVAIAASCTPAREVGGDYYDFLPIDEDRLGLLIADVSGKGTSAAFYMAELKGLMLSLSRIHRSPRDLLIEANQIISDHLDDRSFITVTYAVLDLRLRTLTWARAGHTPLIRLPAGAPGERRAQVLVPNGLVLGLKIDNGERFEALLEEVSLPIEADDVFVFFTDGISEQMNSAEEMFGEGTPWRADRGARRSASGGAARADRPGGPGLCGRRGAARRHDVHPAPRAPRGAAADGRGGPPRRGARAVSVQPRPPAVLGS